MHFEKFSDLKMAGSNHGLILKPDPHLPKKVILFASMKTLWKWWKMLVISS